MRPRSLMLLLLALGCGLIASIGISQVMDRRAASTSGSEEESEPVFVAKVDINTNDPITAELVKLEDWPKSKIPPDAMREMKDVVGRRPRTKIYVGEMIRQAKLISADGDSASEQIPAGYRAYPVRVDAETGTAGLVKPHDRVDVQLFVKGNTSLGIPETKTQTILQNIRVFAVDQHYRRGTDKDDEAAVIARTITLAVTPEQADKLTLATELGKIRLILRHPDDETERRDDGETIDSLFSNGSSDRERERRSVGSAAKGLQAGILNFLRGQQVNREGGQPLAATAPKPGYRMLLVVGSDVQEIEFPQDGGLPHTVSHETQDPATMPTPGQFQQQEASPPDDSGTNPPTTIVDPTLGALNPLSN